MMNKKVLNGLFVSSLACLVLTACASQPVSSQKRETGDLAEFTEDVFQVAGVVGKDKVLAVFDIDNTILAMEQGLGSDQWYEWQKEHASTDPCDLRVVSDRLAVQGALYFTSAMRPTQPDAAEQVRRIQDAGIPVIALTSRGVSFRLQTFRELRRNGFDFRRNPIGPEYGWDEDFVPDNGIRPARYEDGVFLTTGQHKGAMLKALLDRTDTPMPKVIFLADDKQGNLDAVLETFNALNVPIRAWRYTGEDKNVAGFDEVLSHSKLSQLLPALETVERVLGPDNYQLPEHIRNEGCE